MVDTIDNPQIGEKVRLDAAYTDGLAYFSVGDRRYVKEPTEPFREARPADLHPMMTQCRTPNLLAEAGREFPDTNTAGEYVDALTCFDNIRIAAQIATDNNTSEPLRIRGITQLRTAQTATKKYYLETLRTIPTFGDMECLLDMDAQQIQDYLKRKQTT